jgi:hypothetical protein
MDDEANCLHVQHLDVGVLILSRFVAHGNVGTSVLRIYAHSLCFQSSSNFETGSAGTPKLSIIVSLMCQ